MRLIESIPDLEKLADRLAGERLVAADTEAAGYHRYLDRLCLVQLSTRDETWIVDTVQVHSLNPLADLFEDPAVEVVFHDADYDLRLLDRDFAIAVRGLFDTKIAARFVGERAFGLAALLDGELGVQLAKKYQRADWARRPLPADMLEYAAMDTRFLPELRDRLRARLEAMGRLAWAEEEFRLAERQGWEPPEDEENAYLRLKGARDLEPRGLAALRELFRWREDTARDADRAPFRVLSNDVLVAVARELPENTAALQATQGVSAGNARRHGEALLAAVRRARELPEDRLPRWPRPPRRPPRDPEEEALIDRLKVVRDREADRLGLERGFLMPRSQLEALARERPATPEALAGLDGIRHWQAEAMGDALLEALRASAAPGATQRTD